MSSICFLSFWCLTAQSTTEAIVHLTMEAGAWRRGHSRCRPQRASPLLVGTEGGAAGCASDWGLDTERLVITIIPEMSDSSLLLCAGKPECSAERATWQIWKCYCKRPYV